MAEIDGRFELDGSWHGRSQDGEDFDVLGEGMLIAGAPVIARLDGFDKKSADKYAANLPKFFAFYEEIKDNITIVQPKVVTEGALVGQTICFTGFRNKQLEERFVNAGAKIASSLSKSVTILIAADPEESSTKLKKARDQGTRVVGLADVEDLF